MRYQTLAGLLVLAAFAVAMTFPLVASAARLELPVIVVDLAHGQQSNGVCAMMKLVPDAYWVVVVKSEEAAQQLDSCIKNNAYKIIVGDLSKITELPAVDMIIIGQPVDPLNDNEKKTISEWFKSEGDKALWCATDSDYPAQGGNLEAAQTNCNDLLDYMQENKIPVMIRSDYVSVEDPVSNTGRSYRVVALVKPPAMCNASLLALGAHKVLTHGPGAVAWVDEQGNWHKIVDPATGKLTAPKDKCIIPILVTTKNGRIVEHQPKNPGEPGQFGLAHQAGEKGVFVIMAAQVMKMNGTKVVLVSGESPYYGYQSMVTYLYHGVPLDGPRFFRNLVLWATGMYGELKSFEDMMRMGGSSKALEELKKDVMAAKEEAKKAGDAASQAAAKADQALNAANKALKTADNALKAANEAKQLASQAKSAADNAVAKASQALSKASSASTYAIGGIILAIIALIAAGLAIQKAGQKSG